MTYENSRPAGNGAAARAVDETSASVPDGTGYQAPPAVLAALATAMEAHAAARGCGGVFHGWQCPCGRALAVVCGTCDGRVGLLADEPWCTHAHRLVAESVGAAGVPV